MALRLVIFDLDGTLIASPLDFEAIRRELGLASDRPILEALADLPPAERRRAEQVLDRHESAAVRASCPMPGATDLLAWLHRRGVRVALVTRNSRTSLAEAIRRHGLAPDAALSRDDAPPKPSPRPVEHLLATCGARPDEAVLVGDYRFDVEAGRAAGVRTIALAPPGTDWAEAATWRAGDLAEVRRLLGRLLAEP